MRFPIFLSCLCCSIVLIGQHSYAPEKVTVEDYQRAESTLRQYTNDLVYGLNIRPQWISPQSFWYRNTFAEGTEFILVDAQKGKRERAFDHEKLASLLAKSTGEKISPFQLPFYRIEVEKDGAIISFVWRGQKYTYDQSNQELSSETAPEKWGNRYFYAPDGKKAAFIRDHNLWLKMVENGEEKQLTFDGEKDFGYATNNAGWIRNDRPVLLWSPDSKKIATFRHDARGVGEMHLVTTNVGHPKLESWKYPLPEDSVIFRIHRIIIDLDQQMIIPLKMEPDQHRSSVTDHIADRDGTLLDAQWSADGRHFAFLSNSRDHKEAILRIADANTGEVRDILEEKVATFFESGYNTFNWRVLKESNRVIWYSQRSDWGHLYQYDLTTGQLEHPITKGNWKVLQVKRVDETEGKIYFTATGKEPGDPYFQYFYSVKVDGSEEPKRLTKDSANHVIYLSPGGDYFVDYFSTPTTPPQTVLRDKNGKLITLLEKGDISKLLEAGWEAPLPITVKARDGVTDLYGLLYKPGNFDPNKKYPIINSIYPGPQTGSVRGRSFSPSRGDAQALAHLGFVVVQIDAMGTPMRSKSFHDAYYGNMGDNGLPDQITGMKQLAEQYPWIDLDRAGIYGHSGGGFASADAIMRYPDFFKVAVSSAGNHDNRNYEDDWGEKWQGLLRTNPDGTTNYDNQANQLLAENLTGKLLIAHGTMDDNVPYYNTMVVVNALIAANKDFDFILMPNRRHGFGYDPFFMRKKWDYFVKNLLGATPPKEYKFYQLGDRP